MLQTVHAHRAASAFVHAALLAATLFTLACTAKVDEPTGDESSAIGAGTSNAAATADAKAFEGWLARVRETDGTARDLYYAYYDAGAARPWFLSTMVSAEVARYSIARGDLKRADAIGAALLRWQHTGSGKNGARVRGAFPSEIEKQNGKWVARYLYDSGDSATVMTALLDLYTATGTRAYLDAARKTGVWLRDVMAHGEKFGVWKSPLGAPMKSVTSSGDFDNRIAVGRTLFWLPALERLSKLTGDSSFAELASDARAFLELGQQKSGGYADHYDPGWPAQDFDLSRFVAYQSDGAVVADDSLRAAVAAERAGDREAATRFAGWLSRDGGRVAGYLTLADGTPHFPAGNRKYYDVISSALYRALAGDLGLSDAARAQAFLAASQSSDGGWYWGRDAETGKPVDSTQSTLTGVWALVNLLP